VNNQHVLKLVVQLKKITVAKAARIFWLLGRHAFLLIIATTIVNIMLGGAVFYYYVVLAERAGVQSVPVVRFQQDGYDSILAKQAEKTNLFARQIDMQYNDPFK